MKQIGWIVIFGMASCFSACGPGNSGPSSAEGRWTYTTADKKVKVEFELKKNSSNSLDIQNSVLTIEGVTYNSAAQISGVNLPLITFMRVNANDAKAVYSYDIQFAAGTVSNDFNRIDVPNGAYTLAGGTTALKNISIGRP
ncbi:hypothetical protein BH10BAC4_BH10BAC4_24350 [soil metagenome]